MIQGNFLEVLGVLILGMVSIIAFFLKRHIARVDDIDRRVTHIEKELISAEHLLKDLSDIKKSIDIVHDRVDKVLMNLANIPRRNTD